jgi:hypothetical protein
MEVIKNFIKVFSRCAIIHDQDGDGHSHEDAGFLEHV